MSLLSKESKIEFFGSEIFSGVSETHAMFGDHFLYSRDLNVDQVGIL